MKGIVSQRKLNHPQGFVFKAGRYILVHAGLNFNTPDPFKDKQSMLWIRDFDDAISRTDNQFIIHGHTPKPMDFILKQKNKGIVNIDGGCVYKTDIELGNLIALNLTEREFISVRNVE